MAFHQRKPRRLKLENLERRRVLAASLGWDGPGLGSAELSYYIANSPDSLTQEETDAAIKTALDAWADVAEITFTQVDTPGLLDSIDISFVSIDGTAGTLAQAYFPDDVNPARIAGDIQFDIADAWEIGNELGNQAFDLVYVAVHEIGHSLGLDHSDDSASVLAPYVTAAQTFVGLSSDDIEGIQSLYAARDSDTSSGDDTSDSSDDTTETVPTDDTTNDTTDPTDETPDTDNQPFPRNRWRRGGHWQRWGGRLDVELAEHNYVNPTDVNGDQSSDLLDALAIINQLSRSSESSDTNSDIEGLCDTNGDGQISAADALVVINSLMQSEGIETTLESDETDSSDTEGSDTEVDETETTGETDDEGNIDDGGLTDETDETNEDDDADTSDTDTSDTEDDDAGGDTEDDNTDESDVDEETSDEDDLDEDEVDDDADDDADDTEEDSEDCHRPRLHSPLLRANGELLISRFDTNEDALLSEDELPAKVWELLVSQDVDGDSDGVFSSEEIDLAIDSLRQQHFDSLDQDADGVLTETDVAERLWDKLSSADVDADGSLTFEEFDTWLDSDESFLPTDRMHHHQHPHQRRGRRFDPPTDTVPTENSTDQIFAGLGRRRR
ncbi:matrixin family metalloprotease [Stieleria sp. JC731]|uniref:matrixin family metalloprotease n=1 Tax=Pirellulaceae TaxID=2691357 RepID=UPI001E593234|nr:matrixin family metalloprotease [Stieleria sp. JC731]MCC9599528.1 matrixin family metalloprotease [Stieleria sp. JC731]